jgi:hypothetical protein
MNAPALFRMDIDVAPHHNCPMHLMTKDGRTWWTARPKYYCPMWIRLKLAWEFEGIKDMTLTQWFPTKDPLIDRIMYRLGWVRAKDHEEMAYRFSCVLDSATGSRMSKTNYAIHPMLEQIEHYIQLREDEAVEDALMEQAEAQELEDFEFLCDAHKEDNDATD